MRRSGSRITLLSVLFLLAAGAAGPALAQGLVLSPPGDNQRATVTQQIGPVNVTVDYSSPRVVLRGQDRKGKIWGGLVPYGLSDLGYNDCPKCPWRAGANMNTTFAVDHDVQVEGQTLPAGKYGLHMIPGETEWTVVFSKDSNSWGSYWYDPKEDALRVVVKPAKSEYHEWLTYEFTVREPEKATLALMWEEREVPVRIAVPNAKELWVASIRSQLRAGLGFDGRYLQEAADWCVQNKVNLPQALTWAEKAMTPAVGGSETFSTLSTLWRAQLANGKETEAAKTLERALANPTANPIAIHTLGRQLQAEGRNDEAVRVYQMNAKRFPGQWPVNVGLMRAYAMTGDRKKALDYARLAAAEAPDPQNRKNLQNMVKLLEEGKDIPQ
ncbi:MAG TPA: DUF2911 domain-containing protein [Thermoanaerobaculia bacterium]|nr:DUF2911 domain-containing protein [Thermoanaerobaculia bacterium]